MTVVPVPPLQSWQRRLVTIAWITYAAFYLGRSNLAATLPAIEAELALSKGQVGLFVSGFFWAYAIGQLFNGQLGDRVSPRRMIFVGLIVSAALNLIFGVVPIFAVLIVVWTINGYFQSMGWGPVLRILANWLDPDQRRRISTAFGTCFVAGNAIALLLAGWLAENFGWRAAFLVPAGLLALTAIIWTLAVRDTPDEAGHTLVGSSDPGDKKRLRMGDVLRGLVSSLRRFWALSSAALFIGFCLVSMITWLPTYFVEVGGLDLGVSASLSALIPVAGVAGALLTGAWVNRYFVHREVTALTILLVLLAGLFLGFPFLPIQLILSTAALMLIGGVVYGASTLALTGMPLLLGGHEEASSTAGLIDFAVSIGGGLSGVVVGLILQRFNWDWVFFVMAAAALIGAFLVGLTAYRMGRGRSTGLS